jgi:fatty-acid desaturase
MCWNKPTTLPSTLFDYRPTAAQSSVTCGNAAKMAIKPFTTAPRSIQAFLAITWSISITLALHRFIAARSFSVRGNAVAAGAHSAVNRLTVACSQTISGSMVNWLGCLPKDHKPTACFVYRYSNAVVLWQSSPILPPARSS